jgi:hypothetical protein
VVGLAVGGTVVSVAVGATEGGSVLLLSLGAGVGKRVGKITDVGEGETVVFDTDDGAGLGADEFVNAVGALL